MTPDPEVAAQVAESLRLEARRRDPILAAEDDAAEVARRAAEDARMAQAIRKGQRRRQEEERASAREATYQRRLHDHSEALQRGEPGVCTCCGSPLGFLR